MCASLESQGCKLPLLLHAIFLSTSVAVQVGDGGSG